VGLETTFCSSTCMSIACSGYGKSSKALYGIFHLRRKSLAFRCNTELFTSKNIFLSVCKPATSDQQSPPTNIISLHPNICILQLPEHFFRIKERHIMALGPAQPPNRNKYQESSCGVKGGRRVRLTTTPPFVSADCLENVGASTSHNPMGLHGLLQG
jgi:hypothetical protein